MDQPQWSLKYKHFLDNRSEHEIALTINLVKALTELNTKRVSTSALEIKKQKYVFLCLSGLTYFADEFNNLNLPGEVIVKRLQGIGKAHSHEQYLKIINECSLEKEAKQVHDIISKKASEKNVILVYHSFGTFLAAMLFHFFPQTPVKGIIDIGGASISFFPYFKIGMSFLQTKKDKDFQDIQKFHQDYHKVMDDWQKEVKNVGAVRFSNKYQTCIANKYIKNQIIFKLFDHIRNMPNILKLIISGDKDSLVTQNLLSEKAIFFSYKKKFKPEYEEKVKRNYLKIFGKKIENIQQRFIYNLEGGVHVLHMQKKLQQKIKKAVEEFVSVLDID